MNDTNLDAEQAKVIFSKSRKIIVEAPAGFGKTYTMISLLDSWLKTSSIKNYKKILCLSFSLSAVNRMKDSLQSLRKSTYENNLLPIMTTNYHGIGRHILNKYGTYVGLSQSIDDYENSEDVDDVPTEIQQKIQNFKNNIKTDSFSENQLLIEIKEYNNYIREFYLPKLIIPYDGIITLTIELFQSFPNLKHFYGSYFSAICIDEFQDTNRLQLTLVHILMSESTRFVAFGDSMQRIYGFMGAINNLIDKEILEDSVEYIRLKKNYRFTNSPNMNLLDRNLRDFRTNMKRFLPQKIPNIRTIHGKNIQDEAKKIARIINEVYSDKNDKVALLFSQNSKTTKELLKHLTEQNISFYNGFFRDDDEDFVDFQNSASALFQKKYSKKSFKQSDISVFINFLKKQIDESEFLPSFLSLLEGLLRKAVESIDPITRKEYVKDILSQNVLNQSVDEINDRVYVNTIHGAKGLEWDYVIVANFENNELPNYYDMQSIGSFSNEGHLVVNSENVEAIAALINKFYVAFTRAKKEVILSYSDIHWEGYRQKHTKISCLAHISVMHTEEFHFD